MESLFKFDSLFKLDFAGLLFLLDLSDFGYVCLCLLYTSDAADDMQCVDLGGRRIIKKNS